MLDQKVIELADRISEVQFEERQEQLKREIQKLEDEFRSAGAWKSSRLVLLVKELCNQEVVTRTLIVLQALVKVLSTQSKVPAEGLGDSLKQEMLGHRELIISGPLDCLRKIVNKIAPTTISTDLTEGWEHAKKKVLADIDLFILSLEARSERREGQTVFHIQGSQVGAIQLGPGASATTIQMLTVPDREALRKALDRVKQDLARVDKLPGYEKDEVLDLIEEGRAEIGKAKPNSIRLTSVFSAIATAIQTAGSLQPAYQALKAALLPLGIPLP